MKIQPIAEVDDETKFYHGARFRLYDVGLNVNSKEEDYYEYMLTLVPGEAEHLLLTCVEGYKSGSPLALVKTEPHEKYVIAKSLKQSMGIENVFVLSV